MTVTVNPCNTCKYKDNADGGHCYMFKEEPKDCRLNNRQPNTLKKLIDLYFKNTSTQEK